MFSSVGILKCYTNWILIHVDEEIGKYYRHLYKMQVWNTYSLQPPTNSHITLASIHDAKRMGITSWRGLAEDGLEVPFTYTTEVVDTDLYVFLSVISEQAQSVRDKLNLGNPYYPFHLTIGNRKCTQKN